MGMYDGPGARYPCPLFELVAWRWNGPTVRMGALTFLHKVRDNVVPRVSFLHVLSP